MLAAFSVKSHSSYKYRIYHFSCDKSKNQLKTVNSLSCKKILESGYTTLFYKWILASLYQHNSVGLVSTPLFINKLARNIITLYPYSVVIHLTMQRNSYYLVPFRMVQITFLLKC